MRLILTPSSVRAVCLWSSVLVVSGWVWFASSGRDDVHITYWSAHTLATHGAILNYSGVPLEQSSSLLHVLLLAALAWLTRLPLPDLGTLASILFGIAAVIETGRLARRLRSGTENWAMAFAATATPLVYWSFGALETTLVTFLAAAMVRTAHDMLCAERTAPGWAILWSGLYVAARPEGWFVVTAFSASGLALFLLQRASITRILWMWLGASAVFVVLAGWRLHTFGQIFPQPVYAKISGHFSDAVMEGLGHALRVSKQCPGLVALALAAALGAVRALRVPELRSMTTLLVAYIAAQAAFAVASGGDWMEGARFFVPVIPAAAVLAAVALAWIPARAHAAVGVASVVAALGLQPWFAYRFSTGIALPERPDFSAWAVASEFDAQRFSYFEQMNRVHLRDALFLPQVERVVDEWLKREPQVTVMSAQGGMVPYHLVGSRFGKIRFLDMAGLTSKHFADCRVLKQALPVRAAGGIGMTHDFYLAHRAQLEAECSVPRPDVIYDLDEAGFPVARALESAGYRIRYRQELTVCPPGLRCAVSVKSNMFVAERVE